MKWSHTLDFLLSSSLPWILTCFQLKRDCQKSMPAVIKEISSEAYDSDGSDLDLVLIPSLIASSFQALSFKTVCYGQRAHWCGKCLVEIPYSIPWWHNELPSWFFLKTFNLHARDLFHSLTHMVLTLWTFSAKQCQSKCNKTYQSTRNSITIAVIGIHCFHPWIVHLFNSSVM